MLPASTSGDPKVSTPADNQTVRNVFVVGPDKKVKLILVYPMTTGRNFDEVLRVIDSLQLTAAHKVATPANWKQGEDVIITAAVSDEEAAQRFPGYKTIKPYSADDGAARIGFLASCLLTSVRNMTKKASIAGRQSWDACQPPGRSPGG